ncbi:MAG TPA: hypothetical protein VNE39_04455 [Planctomycetota bacterium]|nr:hypothetical protein [Planctomycetota bacterium]
MKARFRRERFCWAAVALLFAASGPSSAGTPPSAPGKPVTRETLDLPNLPKAASPAPSAPHGKRPTPE